MVQMMNNQRLFLRFKFHKLGRLQYVSHLDLVRTMNKIIVRAGLPLWYTEGFNPKPKMIFAAPLSIGTESSCEFMDVRLTETVDPELAKERLNANMTEEMQVSEAYYPTTKFTDMKWLSYRITVDSPHNTEALVAACNALLSADSVKVLKNTKSGEAIVDIRPLIKSATATLEDGRIIISAILSADPSSFLNPEYVVTALREGAGLLTDPCLMNERYSIMREKAFTEDMREFK